MVCYSIQLILVSKCAKLKSAFYKLSSRSFLQLCKCSSAQVNIFFSLNIFNSLILIMKSTRTILKKSGRQAGQPEEPPSCTAHHWEDLCVLSSIQVSVFPPSNLTGSDWTGITGLLGIKGGQFSFSLPLSPTHCFSITHNSE